jgi:hypothetical protein
VLFSQAEVEGRGRGDNYWDLTELEEGEEVGVTHPWGWRVP